MSKAIRQKLTFNEREFKRRICGFFDKGVPGSGDCENLNHHLCYRCKNSRFKNWEEREEYVIATIIRTRKEQFSYWK